MITYQNKILDEFERLSESVKLEMVQSSNASNDGLILAQRGFITVTRLTYHFQNGHNMVVFAGLGNGPGPRSCLWKEPEDHKVAAMFKTWAWLLAGGSPIQLVKVTSNDPFDIIEWLGGNV